MAAASLPRRKYDSSSPTRRLVILRVLRLSCSGASSKFLVAPVKHRRVMVSGDVLNTFDIYYHLNMWSPPSLSEVTPMIFDMGFNSFRLGYLHIYWWCAHKILKYGRNSFKLNFHKFCVFNLWFIIFFLHNKNIQSNNKRLFL